MDDLKCYIGFDPRQAIAWNVCAASLNSRARRPVPVAPIYRRQLEQMGIYARPHNTASEGHWDDISAVPCSTEFSIARFGVPLIAGRSGWALYCDCDLLFRVDVWKLMEQADKQYSVMVVKHDHQPVEPVKMEGEVQRHYPRKNWSSLILWNLTHSGMHKRLPDALNTWHRDRLHAFDWLKEEKIGELTAEWNWLDGSSSLEINPAAVHFTRGLPDMPGYEHTLYAGEWNKYAQAFMRDPHAR